MSPRRLGQRELAFQHRNATWICSSTDTCRDGFCDLLTFVTGQPLAEYGRIAKTLHLLRVVDPVDDTYRRQMNRQLTVQESRHKLARDIYHGRRGQIMQAYRTGQEDQLEALGLVLNAATLWTTRYLDAAVDHLRALPPEEREHDVLDEDVARVSPLKHANLNCLCRYSFAARPPREGLRPLSDPATVHLDEDDEGTGE